jgi:hypothetical protein
MTGLPKSDRNWFDAFNDIAENTAKLAKFIFRSRKFRRHSKAAAVMAEARLLAEIAPPQAHRAG